MAQMRRQSLVKFDAPMCETIVETPKPLGKEVLVRIERCGLCHSDLHIQDGYADLGGGKKLDTTRGMTLPFTLGHEIAGVVEETGPDVAKIWSGRRKRSSRGSAAASAATVSMAMKISASSSAFSGSPSTAVGQPRAGTGRQVPAGLRSAADQSGGHPDVLRRHRLWCVEAPGRPAAAAQSVADRAWRRRHDGLSFAQAMFKRRFRSPISAPPRVKPR